MEHRIKQKYLTAFVLGFFFVCALFLYKSTEAEVQSSYLSSNSEQLNEATNRLQLLLNSLSISSGRSKQNGQWYGEKTPFEFYAYSAFYDDRRSLGALPVLRIIAVSEYLDHRDIHCLFHYKDRPKGYISKVSFLAIGAGVSRHGRGFREYVLTCPLDSEDVPATVSIALSLNEKPGWFMPVEVPARPVVKEDFVTCVSVTYWNQNPYQIVEWMEMLKELGVSKVTIYNNSLNAESARIFQYYDKTGFVDFRQSWNFVPDSGEITIHMHMSPVINDCMYRHMHSAKKIVVTDLDELIIPQQGYTYKDMMKIIDKDHSSTQVERHYMFRNAYFFSDIPHVDESMPKHLKTLRHRWRIAPSGVGYSTKSIISPLACTNMHNHYCWGLTKLYDKSETSFNVPPSYGLNNHYKKCHLDRWEKPGACNQRINDEAVGDDVMLKYKDKLMTRVAKQYEILNLDPL